MSRWFRMYDELLDDPKVQRLPAADFKGWVNLLCLASKNDGRLPSVQDITFALRETENAVSTLLERLLNGGLIERRNGGANGCHYAPYKWDERQYKSDTSTGRVKRFRERSKTVTETPSETETETEQKKEAPSGAYAFVGKVVRLKPDQFERWRTAFPDIDLTARLQQRDDWLATEADERTRKNWFIPTSNWLAKLQGEASREARTPIWDGMA